MMETRLQSKKKAEAAAHTDSSLAADETRATGACAHGSAMARDSPPPVGWELPRTPPSIAPALVKNLLTDSKKSDRPDSRRSMISSSSNNLARRLAAEAELRRAQLEREKETKRQHLERKLELEAEIERNNREKEEIELQNRRKQLERQLELEEEMERKNREIEEIELQARLAALDAGDSQRQGSIYSVATSRTRSWVQTQSAGDCDPVPLREPTAAQASYAPQTAAHLFGTTAMDPRQAENIESPTSRGRSWEQTQSAGFYYPVPFHEPIATQARYAPQTAACLFGNVATDSRPAVDVVPLTYREPTADQISYAPQAAAHLYSRPAVNGELLTSRVRPWEQDQSTEVPYRTPLNEPSAAQASYAPQTAARLYGSVAITDSGPAVSFTSRALSWEQTSPREPVAPQVRFAPQTAAHLCSPALHRESIMYRSRSWEQAPSAGVPYLESFREPAAVPASYAPQTAARLFGTVATDPRPAVQVESSQGATAGSIVHDLSSAIASLTKQSKTCPLPNFSGDYNDWLAFRYNYNRTKDNFSSKVNMCRLSDALRGPAREAVAALLYTCEDPEGILQILEQTFARPEIIVAHEVAMLQSLPKVGTPEQLNSFANKVRNCISTFKALKQQHFLLSPEIFKSVLSKLNELTKSRFCDYAADTQQENVSRLETLSLFLLREADRQLRVMPPDMAIDMRHTKLTPEEAALLAGELKKPSWQSKNEGIHERVSFEDSIWGFDLAGGSYYKTPLRVVAVKPDSRAEKAGIRPGDKLKRINDIDTSTLTIQEAHEIIIEAGVHLRIAVTAPEDEEDAYFCYEDPVDNGYDSDEERRLQEELERKRQVHAKVSSYWSLQWPWVSKRRVIYRESNCFLVPSKFEDKHRDKFPTQPILKTQDDIVLQSAKNEKDNELQSKQTEITNPIINGEPLNGNHKNEEITKSNNSATNSSINGAKENGINGNLGGIPELEEESVHDEVSSSDKDNSVVEAKPQEDNSHTDDISSQNDDTAIELDTKNEMVSNLEQDNQDDDPDTQNEESVAESHSEEVMNSQDDEILDEVLDENDESVSKGEEDNILNSILSNNSEQGVDNSESIDER